MTEHTWSLWGLCLPTESSSSHKFPIKQKQLTFYFIFREKKKSQVWEYSSHTEKKLQSVIFVSQSGILNVLEFLLVSSTISKSKLYASWEHSSALFHRGWHAILYTTPLCLRATLGILIQPFKLLIVQTQTDFLLAFLFWGGQKSGDTNMY